MRKGIILLRQYLSKAAKLVIVITPQIQEVITGMLLPPRAVARGGARGWLDRSTDYNR
jgi:hypothetical protein